VPTRRSERGFKRGSEDRNERVKTDWSTTRCQVNERRRSCRVEHKADPRVRTSRAKRAKKSQESQSQAEPRDRAAKRAVKRAAK